MSDREQFEAWLLARQRARGFGARLTDDEMLAGFRRAGSWTEDLWDAWQARAARPLPETVSMDEYRRVVARCIELGEKIAYGVTAVDADTKTSKTPMP